MVPCHAEVESLLVVYLRTLRHTSRDMEGGVLLVIASDSIDRFELYGHQITLNLALRILRIVFAPDTP